MKKAMKYRSLVLIIVVIVLLMANDIQASILIDKFHTEDEQILEQTLEDINYSTSDYSDDIIGGYRYMEILVIDADTDPQSFSATGGVLSLVSTASGSATGTVIWDSDMAMAGLGGLDLTQSGANEAFNMTMDAIDPDVHLVLTVEDDLFNEAYLSQSGLSAGNFSYVFSDFTDDDIVDWTSIEAITLEAVGGIGSNFSLSFLEAGQIPAAVPEPATMTLLGMGLISIVGISRKKFIR